LPGWPIISLEKIGSSPKRVGKNLAEKHHPARTQGVRPPKADRIGGGNLAPERMACVPRSIESATSCPKINPLLVFRKKQ